MSGDAVCRETRRQECRATDDARLSTRRGRMPPALSLKVRLEGWQGDPKIAGA